MATARPAARQEMNAAADKLPASCSLIMFIVAHAVKKRGSIILYEQLAEWFVLPRLVVSRRRTD